MPSADSAARAPRILWEVMEEHLDEGAYGLVCFARALESPARTLSDLARYPEERMMAQVDALLVGGASVRERLLEPVLAPAREEHAEADVEPERMSLAAWALMDAGTFTAIDAALDDPRPELEAALATAARHAQNPSFDALLLQKLSGENLGERRTALLLALAAARRVAVPDLLGSIQSADVALQRSAARAALHGDSTRLLGVMQYLLEHEDAGVRDAALLASLAWGSQKAWLDCKRWAFDPAQPSPRATLLTAALGTRADHEQLLPLLSRESTRHALLFALGFAGNTALYPALAPFLTSEDPRDAKLAAQSLGLIFGFAPAADAFGLPPSPAPVERTQLPPPEEDPEARASLPPLEEDDLDADLVPPPEAALPLPNAVAIAQHCAERTKALGTKTRVLYGHPFSAEQVARVLGSAPLRVRHGVALALGVRSGGSLWVDTRAATAVQRAQLTRSAALGLPRFVEF